MACDPGSDPRDWHLGAIEAIRHGDKAEAIELLEQLAQWAEPYDAAYRIYSQLRTYLIRDDADLIEARGLLEDALEWVDGLPQVEEVEGVEVLVGAGMDQREANALWN